MKIARVIAIIDSQESVETSRPQLLHVCELQFDGAATDAEYVVLNAAGARIGEMVLLQETDGETEYRATEIVQSIETLAREATDVGAARGRIV